VKAWRRFSVRHFILEFICCHFILEPSSVKYILFDHEVYLLEFICFNTTVICCHFIEQTNTKSFAVPSTAAQQQMGSSCRYQQQHDNSSVPRQQQGRCVKEYARVQIRTRHPTMASGDFWHTCLANCWREFFY